MRTSLLGVFLLGRKSGYASARSASYRHSGLPGGMRPGGRASYRWRSELVLKLEREANAIFLVNLELVCLWRLR